MENYKLHFFPDPILFKPTEKVILFDESLHKILDTMHEAISKYNGLGIAAPQIGASLSMFLLKSVNDNTVEIINPIVVESTGNQTFNEGCLSAPGIFVPTIRPKEIHFKYQDRHGENKEAVVQDLEAIIFAHENEHLSGGFFLQQTSRNQRRLAMKKLGMK